jgi:hypothetical protein
MFCVDKIWFYRRFLILCPLFVILQIAKGLTGDGSKRVLAHSVPSELKYCSKVTRLLLEGNENMHFRPVPLIDQANK